MHYVLTTAGSAGDVYPMIGLAIQLQQRGHRVTLITNGHFSPVATRYGVTLEPLGTEADYYAAIQNPDLWNPRRAFRHISTFIEPFLKRQYEMIVQHARQGDVRVIASCLAFGARMAQDHEQIPTLTVHLQPAVIWSDLAPPQIGGLRGPRWLRSFAYRFGEKMFADRAICPFLNRWRRELGLPVVKRITRWWNSPEGILCLFPDWFAAPQSDWPQPVLQANFPLWNENSEQSLPEDVAEFLNEGEPPIVFTPGTANIHGHHFFRGAVEACRALNRRGVLLTRFTEQIPASLPDGIRHFSYVPLDLLLSRSAAFVHHGGIGSTSQALFAGIPQVCVPLAHDQFDNAVRVKNLNVGTGIPGKRHFTQSLIRNLYWLLNSSRVAESCRSYQQRLAPRNGLVLAADKIEHHFARPA